MTLANTIILNEVLDDFKHELGTGYSKAFQRGVEELGWYSNYSLQTALEQPVSSGQLIVLFKYISMKMTGDFQYCRFKDLERCELRKVGCYI